MLVGEANKGILKMIRGPLVLVEIRHRDNERTKLIRQLPPRAGFKGQNHQRKKRSLRKKAEIEKDSIFLLIC